MHRTQHCHIMQVIYLILLIDTALNALHTSYIDRMCECERLCCVRARVNIYLVADWLETIKKSEKKSGKSGINFSFRRV